VQVTRDGNNVLTEVLIREANEIEAYMASFAN